MVGQIELTGTVPLHLFYPPPPPQKWEMAIVRVIRKKIDWECEGKSSKKIRVKVAEVEFSHITTWGYMIISEVDIFYLKKGYPIFKNTEDPIIRE